MITLTCAKCGTTLRVDDGFAGGVCRCNRCGTIQTVPSADAVATASAVDAKPAGQALYERTGRADGTDRDLAQLHEVVTSSGIAGSGLSTGRGSTPRRPRDPTVDVDVLGSAPPRAAWPIVLAAVASALVAGGVGVGLWLGRNAKPAANPSPSDAKVNDAAAGLPAGPRFGTVPLTELSPVIYLIDRDAATRGSATPIRASILRSAGTLRAPRKFQIRFVAPPGEPFAAYPAAGPAEPSAEALLAAGRWFDDAPPSKATSAADVAGSIENALAAKPGEIVLVTASAAPLDAAFVDRVADALKRSPEVRLHALSIGSPAGTPSLATLCEQSRGRLLVVGSGAPMTEFARR